jgi:hypothetical protein
MCEQLTSVGINVREPYKLAIHTINSHSKTWHELKLETSADRCDWREMEWHEKNDQPTIRWRNEDDEETQVRVMDWVLSNWLTRNGMISHCLMNAKTVDASYATGLTTLTCPNAEYVNASDATGLTTLTCPKNATVYR